MSDSGPGPGDDKAPAQGIDESGKLRRVYRHCTSCKAVVGVATRTCPQCETVLFERQASTKVKTAKRKSVTQGGAQEEDAGPAVPGEASDGGAPSDADAVLLIATNHSRPQEAEKLDLAPFEREDPEDTRVMAEVSAGSNVFYQAWLVAESLTEVKLRFPATRKQQEERVEWVDKRSSRLSRQGLSTRLWTFVKGSDGAWVPKGSEPKGGVPGLGRKRPAGSTGATPVASSDLGQARTTSGGAARRAGSYVEATGGDSERGKAAGEDPLAAWFKRQKDVLQRCGMVLPGCAESGGEAELKRSRGRPAKKQQGGAAYTAEGSSSSSSSSSTGSEADGGSTDGAAVLSGGCSHAVRDTAGGGAPPHTAPNPPVSKLPSRQLSVLEEDDLFSGGPGKKAQVAPGGSPQLPPMIATLPGPPVLQKPAGAMPAKQPSDNVLKPAAAVLQPCPPAPVATLASHLFKRKPPSASDAVAESGGSTRMPDRDAGDHAAVEGPLAAAAEMIPGIGPSRSTGK